MQQKENPRSYPIAPYPHSEYSLSRAGFLDPTQYTHPIDVSEQLCQQSLSGWPYDLNFV